MNEKFMELAIIEAKKSLKYGDVPVGAVIEKDGVVLAKAHNKKMKKGCATRHAEIIAIEKACRKVKDYRLNGCNIYVTLEPCIMCYGAVLSARLDNLYFGAFDKKYSISEVEKVVSFNHKTTLAGGVMEKECSELISGFFSDLRKEKCKH